MGEWLILTARKNTLSNSHFSLDPFWTGIFFAISAFNNSGMALLDANAVALNNSYL